MKEILQKASWALKRILFIIYYLSVAFSGGLMAYVLFPVSTYLFFNDFRFWRYTRLIFPGIKTLYHQLFLIITDKDYRHMFSVPLIAPPMTQPDKTQLALSPTWETEETECQGCSHCCIMLGCGFFEQEKGICLCYNSFYWRYFNCGRYPSSQKQIDYYKCPKWVIKQQNSKKLTTDPKSRAAQCNCQQENARG